MELYRIWHEAALVLQSIAGVALGALGAQICSLAPQPTLRKLLVVMMVSYMMLMLLAATMGANALWRMVREWGQQGDAGRGWN